MEICTELIGNIHEPEWKDRLEKLDIEFVPLDQWTAQKSRFLATGEKGTEYPVALKRQSQVLDGDIIFLDENAGRAAVLKLDLNPVMVIDLSSLASQDAGQVIRRALELGHAIGNQHWPAVVKGAKVYVPLTVDRKVMLSVMDTHHLEGISYEFQEGREVIPYMAPHEIRRLFGGASHGNQHIHAHPHEHGGHEHSHDHSGHAHFDGDHAHARERHGHACESREADSNGR